MSGLAAFSYTVSQRFCLPHWDMLHTPGSYENGVGGAQGAEGVPG